MTDEQRAKIREKLKAWKADALLFAYGSMFGKQEVDDEDGLERYGMLRDEILARMERGSSNA